MKKSRMPASSVPNTAGGASSVERFRQQREQRDAEQRADGVADQPRHEPRPDVGGKEEERRGDEQAAAAAEKAQAERGREHMHATFYCGLRIGADCGAERNVRIGREIALEPCRAQLAT